MDEIKSKENVRNFKKNIIIKKYVKMNVTLNYLCILDAQQKLTHSF